MARDIDRKLRLTAAALGVTTCKDLAAAFRSVNPATSFDVERGYKWLQGRARPREFRVYEDWAVLLDMGHSGDWIAESEVGAFLDAICARRHLAPETLLRRAEVFSGASTARHPEPSRGRELVGTYACYSHAWSPYFRGKLIRGVLSIAPAPDRQRLHATYGENLPTGRIQVEGPVTISDRMLHLDLREPGGGAQLTFCLYPPTVPASVLGGLMCGITFLGPDPQPSVTRVVMIRLPAATPGLHAVEAYLPSQASLAEDLAALGLEVGAPDIVDKCLKEFLVGVGGAAMDQVPSTGYRKLIELFDRNWFDRASPLEVDEVSDSL